MMVMTMGNRKITYGHQRCEVCGKRITTCGMGFVSHMRAHVRRGEAREHFIEREFGPCYYVYTKEDK